MKYKVLTLWQPFATLLVHGEKQIETRPSATKWTIDKGSYLIHSAKLWNKELDKLSKHDPFCSSLFKISEKINNPDNLLTLGHIIGSINIQECILIENIEKIIENEVFTGDYNLISSGKTIKISAKEYAFGNYKIGRFAWICSNPKILKSPIPYKGGQGYYQNFNGDIQTLEFE